MEFFQGHPLYKFKFDDESFLDCMSIVKEAANETKTIKLSKLGVEKYSYNNEKQIITGCALRANYPIKRKNLEGETYFIEFPPEEIEKLVWKFMKDKKLDEVNINHDDKKFVDDVYLIESFFLSKNHKINYPEFQDLAEGSWMVSYKADNESVWEIIKKKFADEFSPEIIGGFAEPNFSEELELLNIII